MWCPKFVAQPDGANLPVINAIFQDNAWGRTVIVDNLEKKRCEDNDVFASCTWRADFNSFTPALLYVEHTYNSISKFSFCSLNGSTILRLLWRNNVSDAPPSHSIRSHWSFFFCGRCTWFSKFLHRCRVFGTSIAFIFVGHCNDDPTAELRRSTPTEATALSKQELEKTIVLFCGLSPADALRVTTSSCGARVIVPRKTPCGLWVWCS